MPPKSSRKGSGGDSTTNKTGGSSSSSNGSGSKAVNNGPPAASKATTVSVSSSGYSTPVKPPPDATTFKPGTTAVKFYSEEMQRNSKKMVRPSSRPTSKGFSLRRLAVQLTLLYAFIAYFFVCPNDPGRMPNVCRSFEDVQAYRNQAIAYVTPYAQPYIDQVRSRLDPYTTPYINAGKPYYSRAQKALRPHLNRGRKVYDDAVRPRLLDAVTRSHQAILPHCNRLAYEYQRHLGPYVDRYTRLYNEIYDINVKPRVDELSREYRKTVTPLLRRATNRVGPILANAYPATQYHLRNTLLPVASRTYGTSARVYSAHIHPRIVSTYYLMLDLLRNQVYPQIGRFNSRYISPQLSKIQDKAWANKAKKVAEDKVQEMNHDLGKSDITDEIDELLSEIKAAESSSTIPSVRSTILNSVEPTAVDEFAEPSEKPDAVSQKLAEDEQRAALNAEKRKATLALHDLYDVEIPKLGETELALLADRLAALRKSALRDIPIRFDTAIRAYEADCEKWVGRLEKYWEKAKRDERTSLEDKIADGQLIARRARSKLSEQAEDLEDELDSYLRTHNVREVTSVEKAFATISNFIGKAQDELGTGYAWLDDVTHEDWKRYHTLGAVEGSWHHTLFGLKNGTVQHSALDRSLAIEPAIRALRSRLEDIHHAAENRLKAAGTVGEKHVKGEFVGVADAAASGYSALSEGMTGILASATQAVVGTPQPSDLPGTISSVYEESLSSASSLGSELAASGESLLSVASASGESAASVVSSQMQQVASTVSAAILPTAVAQALEGGAAEVNAAVSSLYASASQQIYLAVGATPSPTDYRQSAESILARASVYLNEVQDGAGSLFSSYANEASKTAMSFAGQTPAPTGYQESLSSYASVMAAEINSAAANAQSLAAKIGHDAIAALPAISLPTTDDLPALSDLSSSVHSVTREAYKAVGVSVTPESFNEHAESAYNQAASLASSVASNVAEAVPSIDLDDLSSSLHTATRSLASAVGATPSPEGVSEHLGSAYSAATGSASSILSKATASIAPTASSIYEQAGATASSVLDAASSAVHQATRSAASAVGLQPTPEGLREHAESIASDVSEAVASVTAAVRERAEL